MGTCHLVGDVVAEVGQEAHQAPLPVEQVPAYSSGLGGIGVLGGGALALLALVEQRLLVLLVLVEQRLLGLLVLVQLVAQLALDLGVLLLLLAKQTVLVLLVLVQQGAHQVQLRQAEARLSARGMQYLNFLDKQCIWVSRQARPQQETPHTHMRAV